MYKLCMAKDNHPIEHVQALAEVQLALLGARLEAARVRKFDTRAAAIDALDQQWGVKRRTYYSHEAGERRPKMEDLERYSRTFDAPLHYFLFGDDAVIPSSTVMVYANQKKARLRPVINKDESTGSDDPINQDFEDFYLNTSHNRGVRSIVVLSAEQIRRMSTGGGLASMSGDTIPVPSFLNAGPNSFWYRIPAHDLAMINDGPFSLKPGTAILVDLDRAISPNDYVLADLNHLDQPVVRQYKALTARGEGPGFQLEALNPAYDPIKVADPKDCLSIGRIIFYGSIL